MNLKFNTKFAIKKKIGQGAFGDLFKAINTQNQEQVAIKLEKTDSQCPQLIYEAKLYQYLEGKQAIGFSRLIGFGTEHKYNYLILELLGHNLEYLLQQNKGKLSIKTVLLISDQMLQRLEYLHSKNFIHRDIKPENICMGGKKDKETLYLIDFGLSKRFIDKNGDHIPMVQNKALTGTLRYASLAAQSGSEQSRRDDLESWGFIMIYFLKGNLPWQGLKAKTQEEHFQMILNKKKSTTLQQLCEGLPKEIFDYLHYCRQLKYDQKPDYKLLRNQLKNLMCKNGEQYDKNYDWSQKAISKEQKSQIYQSYIQNNQLDLQSQIHAVGVVRPQSTQSNFKLVDHMQANKYKGPKIAIQKE